MLKDYEKLTDDEVAELILSHNDVCLYLDVNRQRGLKPIFSRLYKHGFITFDKDKNEFIKLRAFSFYYLDSPEVKLLDVVQYQPKWEYDEYNEIQTGFTNN